MHQTVRIASFSFEFSDRELILTQKSPLLRYHKSHNVCKYNVACWTMSERCMTKALEVRATNVTIGTSAAKGKANANSSFERCEFSILDLFFKILIWIRCWECIMLVGLRDCMDHSSLKIFIVDWKEKAVAYFAVRNVLTIAVVM